MKGPHSTRTSFGFDTRLIEWRGPAPFVFAPVPLQHNAEIRHAAHSASYGWGVVPVTAMIGSTCFTTSMIPREGRYLLPIKAIVQRAENIGPGLDVAVTIEIA